MSLTGKGQEAVNGHSFRIYRPVVLTRCVAGMIYFERATTEFRNLLVAEPDL